MKRRDPRDRGCMRLVLQEVQPQCNQVQWPLVRGHQDDVLAVKRGMHLVPANPGAPRMAGDSCLLMSEVLWKGLESLWQQWDPLLGLVRVPELE